ncbi:LysR family transcriptional regulator [Silvibacterium dinghuense]|uniref:LysR family transcriptional regulator n=1 Tax=Silvibacterium dinghuense TaxID=1560006 RepID=A0A4Q1S9Q5_9BACT|nr:LysR family transcriptional regulator [Silvibacterium dinghuense]RXS93758.1 LysR family transcriptional regulator [Silvibacterium dinghuense]GGH07370.1 LysR family transcriptional regulator [Silvibacterium dinghuense]
MELRHLRYFITVAETGGFGRAAKLLHVAQSAISEQIRDLETELGVPLFDRQNRRIQLTYQGEQFLEDARAVMEQATRAVENVQRTQRGEVGKLTVGFFVGGMGPFFSAIIREFRRIYPGIQVSLVEMAPGMQYQALQAGTIDVSFTRTLPAVHASQLRSEPLRTEPFYAVLLRTHPLARQPSVFMRELAGETFILNDRRYSPAVFDKVITLCTEAGFSPKLGATGSVSSGVIALVEAGEGVAILPQGSRILGSEDIVWVPLADKGAVIDMVVAWSPKMERPALKSFLEMVRRRRKVEKM